MATAIIAPTQARTHLTFGIVADVQYADCDDQIDHLPRRYYRNSVNLLQNAVDAWKHSVDPVAFVIQLGDLIDGKNKTGGESNRKKALDTALRPLNSLGVPVFHVIGNHDLYNFNRTFILGSPLNSSQSLSTKPNTNRLYYTFLPHPKLRIVALDTYEVGLLGYDDNPDDENYKTAKVWLRENNKNEDVYDIAGLEGFETRWGSWNGGISDEQLHWLSQVLQEAQSKEENVIIITHIALQCRYENCNGCLVWNYEDVMKIIHRFQCVIGVLAGHEHSGWHTVDDHGIQHITFPAILETSPGENAYATARLWDQTLTVCGVGVVPSFTILLRYHI